MNINAAAFVSGTNSDYENTTKVFCPKVEIEKSSVKDCTNIRVTDLINSSLSNLNTHKPQKEVNNIIRLSTTSIKQISGFYLTTLTAYEFFNVLSTI